MQLYHGSECMLLVIDISCCLFAVANSAISMCTAESTGSEHGRWLNVGGKVAFAEALPSQTEDEDEAAMLLAAAPSLTCPLVCGLFVCRDILQEKCICPQGQI